MINLDGIKRSPAPKHPKTRDKDPEAYDAYQRWLVEQEVARQETTRQVEANKEDKAKKQQEAAQEFNRKADVVMDALTNNATSVPVTAKDIKTAQDYQIQDYVDALNKYKLGLRSLATVTELGLSGASLLGAYANWKNWANAASATKRGIANLLEKAQAPMQAGGTVIDGFQTYDAYTQDDVLNQYYNGGSGVLGAAGTVGAMDAFRGTHPKVDRVLDILGIVQNIGDFVKFGYDTLFKRSLEEGGK